MVQHLHKTGHTMLTAPRLACDQCRSRKVKCNKASPCSACKTAGLHCHTVQRARLPRGKSGKGRAQSNKLEERVARIESLLARNTAASSGAQPTLQCDSPPTTDSSLTTRSEITPSAYESDLATRSLIASDFWTALSEEVYGLREILESPDDDSEEESQGRRFPVPGLSMSVGTTRMLFQYADAGTNHHKSTNTPFLSPGIKGRLLQIYRSRVDKVYKILHWPSVLRMIEGKNEQGTAETLSDLPTEALENSIYFMSICSITVAEAKEMGLGDRLDSLQQCRAHLEALLARTSLVHAPTIVLLQAFIIYLIGLRTCLSGAYTWTLVAVAVRLAAAMRLGAENPTTHTSLEVQLRRRLLFGIGILDTHSALDRGTVPIMPSSAFTAPPLNIDDVDISPTNTLSTLSGIGITDMSHTAMIYQAMICQRRLYELSENTPCSWYVWHEKLGLVSSFGNYVQRTTSSIGDSSPPLDKLLKISGDKILISLQLLLRRPPYRQPRNSVPPWDNFNILEAATSVLEQHLRPFSPEFDPWAWKNWIQWHALAVVLAELAMDPGSEDFDRAYTIATKSFQHYAQIVADSDTGMLWKPIAKLMRRVELIRQRKHHEQVPIVQPDISLASDDLKDDARYMNNTMDESFFDITSWDLNGHGTSLSTDRNDYTSKEDNIEFDMPWLAWDAFVQDMSLPDT